MADEIKDKFIDRTARLIFEKDLTPTLKDARRLAEDIHFESRECFFGDDNGLDGDYCSDCGNLCAFCGGG